MSFVSPPPRRGPEPICFQPLAPIEHPDDHTPVADFFLNMLFVLAGVWIVGSVIVVLAIGGR
ncbi:hypothetical protein [uncultured Sphingomonas sp.]|uniref:hypothetical protein n=1 Tax=uncultured Sphingomonas sp. TaxID=158754 RepID=UPI0026012058|nr:hypothetical protein [uncultured Sphingomonas sp.]